MTYNKNGIGLAEMTEVALYMPEIFDTVTQALNDGENEAEILDTVHKAISAYNEGLL